MNMNVMNDRTEFITARASSTERMIAERLQLTLGLENQSQLVRSLIEQKAAELGVV